MSASIIAQVQDAIARNLHVLVPDGGVIGPGYRYPVEIAESGDIILRDSDCGLAKPTITWSAETWRKYVSEDGSGLYRKVGFWAFEQADDPAADDISRCHRSPGWSGRVMHQLRKELDEANAVKASLLEALRYCESWFSKHSPTASLITGQTAEHPMLTCIRAAIAEATGDEQ